MSRRALSVRWPWASLIGNGLKTIELRTWSTTHRGELHVQQALGRDEVEPWLAELAGEGVPGHVTSRVNLIDCRPATLEDADAACVTVDELRARMAEAELRGRVVHAWRLSGAAPVAPVPLRGMPGCLLRF